MAGISAASLLPEQYEAYAKQQDLTFKTEVTTTVIQEASALASQTEQRQVLTPISAASEKVRSLWTPRCSKEAFG